MNNRLAFVSAILMLFAASARPALAHHSSASYDMEHQITMTGTVTNFEWTNPHVFIYLDVKDDSSTVVQWRVEGNSPNMLSRVGWSKDLIKPGDKITVSGAPAKNKAPVLRLVGITLGNGLKFDGQGFK